MAAKVTTLKDQVRVVQRRMEALGVTAYPVPVNSGKRRTASKKALLKELEQLRQHAVDAEAGDTAKR